MVLVISSFAEIDILARGWEDEADGQAADENDAADPSAGSVVRLHSAESSGDSHNRSAADPSGPGIRPSTFCKDLSKLPTPAARTAGARIRIAGRPAELEVFNDYL